VISSEIASNASSVEETALALEALLIDPGRVPQDVISQGLNWLTVRVQQGTYRENSPIGFYFAKLWYHERLYPLVFAAAALGRAVRQGERSGKSQRPPLSSG
jgi:squalene-hopene/tetraprenyl-beta-curcumene cyclase